MAVMLSLTMILSMGFTTSAQGTGSLTVKIAGKQNTLEGQTIYLFKLFDFVADSASQEEMEKSENYKVNEEYRNILKRALQIEEDNDNAIFRALQQKDEIGTFAETFTQLLLEEKNENLLDADHSSEKIPNDGNDSQTVRKYTFEGIEYGYYLVYQTGTTKLQSSLVTVAGAKTEVELKGDAPEVEKTVEGEEEISAEIGKIVTYQVKTKIPDTTGYSDYVFTIHDTLSKGLDFVDENNNVVTGSSLTVPVNVAIGNMEQDSLKADVTYNEDGTKSMELDLSNKIGGDWQAYKGQELVLTYSAKVNTDAVAINKNEASVEYGNALGDTTHSTPDVAIVNTYDIKIKKRNPDGELLKDAKFALYKNEEDAKKNDTSNAIHVTGQDGQYHVNPNSQNFEMASSSENFGGEVPNENYNLYINGLAEGEYWLVETEAPEGYDKINEPIRITIVKEGTDTFHIEVNGEKVNIIDILNNIGSLLPGTGGMGTMIFTAIGVVLILGVAGSFVISRRKKSEE